ncbi:potassium channel family protein [Crocosphaera sp. XPORK-15E]|uniref:potassium channel family protein n=1 Tax=Crocosphaera sp. XPORK-15E TaxID=3110247 RepID=UPI002B1F42AE|nr:potassium channel family protein [Crocosphaera sp. XPORK-15E]MEA5536587.1 potassium channel family protein [Crocosphaera sp. XPORK-15E]
MKVNSRSKLHQKTYTKLLIALIIVFFVSSLVTNRITGLILSLCFLLSNLLTLEALSINPKFLTLLRIIAGTGFIFDVFYFPQYEYFSEKLSVIAYICYAAFCLAAILVISKRIFSTKKVSQDILRGGICVYLLLGLFWFLLYRIIFLFDHEAFTNLSGNNVGYQLSYFSFTTLTTLGYGDITPVHSFAMTLTNAQAIIGQLYPAIFIARLVSLYQHDLDNTDQ